MINNQSKNKVLVVIIAILVIANISILAFFLQKKEPEKQAVKTDRKTMISNFLRDEVGFNQQQLKQYDSLSNRQREKMGGLWDQIKNRKNDQLKTMAAADFSDSVMNAIADQTSATQKQMELQMYSHIKSIRQLCTPDQLPKFDSSFIKVFNRKGDGKKNQQNKK